MTQETFDALNAESDWMLAMIPRTLSQAGLCDAIRTRAAERRMEWEKQEADVAKHAEANRHYWDSLPSKPPADFPPEPLAVDSGTHAGPDVSELGEDSPGV